MTRINLVHPEHLTDKHLLAEYKEITRPFNKMINRIEKYGYKDALKGCDIPDTYVLGKGHESFFFNKLEWLYNRYWLLRDELLYRGVNVDIKKFETICKDFLKVLKFGDVGDSLFHDNLYWHNYTPTPEEVYLNMARLVIRSNLEIPIREVKI